MQEITPNWRYKVIFNNQIESIPQIMTTSKAQSLSKLTIWKIENAQKLLETVASCPQNLSPKNNGSHSWGMHGSFTYRRIRMGVVRWSTLLSETSFDNFMPLCNGDSNKVGQVTHTRA